jgi:hypothetical protein
MGEKKKGLTLELGITVIEMGDGVPPHHSEPLVKAMRNIINNDSPCFKGLSLSVFLFPKNSIFQLGTLLVLDLFFSALNHLRSGQVVRLYERSACSVFTERSKGPSFCLPGLQKKRMECEGGGGGEDIPLTNFSYSLTLSWRNHESSSTRLPSSLLPWPPLPRLRPQLPLLLPLGPLLRLPHLARPPLISNPNDLQAIVREDFSTSELKIFILFSFPIIFVNLQFQLFRVNY